MSETVLGNAHPPSSTDHQGTLSSISQIQKAAIIIAVLGADGAKPIVDKLDDQALAQVMSALETLSFLSKQDIVEVIADFVQSLQSLEGGLRAGPDRARAIVSDVFGANRLSAVFQNDDADPVDIGSAPDRMNAWRRIMDRDPEDIADYLSRLPANVAAMVLSQLDVAIASSVLAHFDDDKLRAAVENLISVQVVDPGVISAIERMVEIEFLNTSDSVPEIDEGQFEDVGEVLSLLPTHKRDPLMDFLRQEHELKLTAIEKSMLTIEGLPETLPRNMVPTIFRELPNPAILELLSSLADRYDAVSEFLLSNISSRMADQYKDDLAALPRPDDEQAAEVQRGFLVQLMDMKRRGLVTFAAAEKAAS